MMIGDQLEPNQVNAQYYARLVRCLVSTFHQTIEPTQIGKCFTSVGYYEAHRNVVRWKYTLYVGIDANFRLKRLDVSSEERDPGLNHGYAYMVETKGFTAYLNEFAEAIQDEKSTCNDHNALKQASLKGGRGTKSTGIGTVDCARHDMKRPVSLGDLQKGERYEILLSSESQTLIHYQLRQHGLLFYVFNEADSSSRRCCII
jgi:hypothetical protein